MKRISAFYFVGLAVLKLIMDSINERFTVFDIFFVILAGLPLLADKKVDAPVIWRNCFIHMPVCDFGCICFSCERCSTSFASAIADLWHGVCIKSSDTVFRTTYDRNY
ncbi:hypothetical protein [Chryseobacterium vaccae]|uniref:hypothetical protein n=1 Tax=Chryseobacterium vaccae TaxID=2604424 RepID=UPI001295D96A|nr:hypothetical protein [Chryseobacterium vaccae]